MSYGDGVELEQQNTVGLSRPHIADVTTELSIEDCASGSS